MKEKCTQRKQNEQRNKQVKHTNKQTTAQKLMNPIYWGSKDRRPAKPQSSVSPPDWDGASLKRMSDRIKSPVFALKYLAYVRRNRLARLFPYSLWCMWRVFFNTFMHWQCTVIPAGPRYPALLCLSPALLLSSTQPPALGYNHDSHLYYA